MIRIAVVSSKKFAEEIKKFENEVPTSRVTYYTYDNPLESLAIVKGIRECDVIMFAGPLPYFLSKACTKARNLPSVFIPSDEYTLTHTLLYLLLNRKEGLKGLSIDIHNEHHLHQVAEEMNMDVSDWHVLDSKETITENQVTIDPNAVLEFHQNLWESGKTTYAVTNIDYVRDRLQKMGIPSTAIIVPGKAIIDTFQQAIMCGKLSISKNMEFSVGIISVTLSGAELTTEGEQAALAEQMLTYLARNLESPIQKKSPGQFIVYGTIGSMELFLYSERLQKLLNHFSEVQQLVIHIGCGAGMTAKEAEENAQTALFYARRKSLEHSVFFMTAEKKIIGPLNELVKTFQVKTEDTETLKVAGKTHLSVATVTKLQEFAKLRHDEGFTTVQLSEYLEIGRRSAERLMKKIIEEGYALQIGEEQPYSKGRPRSVYRMNLN
ncbi:transcriptional regulator [Planococcus sp. ANT_H30]|uniref:transcriptional regulator n=1 Tax=Planococcus sp. ANT_H30 TaxID=2597347 RepID=UPI0011ECE015|nr:transcriptional regulator [Planococcus sp. ANT_H30]KAA0956949.1 transcriptional regulator [Planococcus sp. ANT_H30]